jgi:peptidoglycan hydrolase CwlO-like protein
MMAVVVAAVLLSLGLASPVLADSASTKKQLDADKAKLASLEKSLSSEQATVNSLQRQADALATQISRVQDDIATTQFRIVKKTADIDAAQQQLVSAQGQLDHRAWVAYENGPGTSLDFLLGATSLSDLSTRLEIVDHVAQSDQDLVAQVQGLQNRLLARKGELTALKSSLQARQKDLQSQETKLQANLAQEQQVLSQLDTDKANLDSLISSLTAKYKKELAAEAAAARRAAQGSGWTGGTSIGGVFNVCPVAAPRAYGDDFGAPRYSGGYHPHAGNDIVASRGTPIYAPFDGTATDASNGLGGIAVIVTASNGIGYVYNAHMDSIIRLGSVAAGTEIGTVGDSGDAKGGITHDHFEFHPANISQFQPLYKSYYGYTQIGDAIDPYPFLNSVCR